ncbi:MAG TPA: DUF4013 domain-containing protein [Longimicrobiales bacterium]|nr:DUF4013 domain-containing protein [Longimicrobiales bacterium]
MLMRLDWKTALTFMTRDQHWKRKLLIGGALFFPLPPLGWMMALGFRSLTGPRLVDGMEPVLPEWRGNLTHILQRGALAVFVILSHFSPFFVCYWLFGLDSTAALQQHWREVVVFVTAIALFPPLFLPTLPLAYALNFPWLAFSTGEIAVLAILFLGAFFILPASFVQIGMYGSYASAFRARSAWRFVLCHKRLYAEAWVISLLVSAIAVSMGPFMPWGLFWSYLVILHVFLDALARSDTPGVRERFARAALLRPRRDA